MGKDKKSTTIRFSTWSISLPISDIIMRLYSYKAKQKKTQTHNNQRTNKTMRFHVHVFKAKRKTKNIRFKEIIALLKSIKLLCKSFSIEKIKE